jgi:hypothetical protein
VIRKTTGKRAAVLLFAFALAAGYASAEDQPAATPQYSGFLSDYSRLTPAPDNASAKRWVDKDFDFKPYDKIMLAPVEVWVSPTSEYKGADPAALKRMADDFTRSFEKALHPGYLLVHKPGPGVLHIRIAITGINLVKPSMKPRDFVPVVFVYRAISGSMEAKHAELTGEMQVLGPEKKIVAEILASGTSDEAIKEKQDITWTDLKSITDGWAKALRKGLDTARGMARK